MFQWKPRGLLWLAFWILFADITVIKTLQILTCECQGIGQPFNAWFYPAFHHPPYSYWWTYHGITWLAGPYSLLWWGLNSPAYLGYWAFNLYILSVDLAFTVYLYKRKPKGYTALWLGLSLWFFGAGPDPIDFFPVLFTFLGRWSWKWLLLGPLTKLPVGAPLWVWEWIVSNPNSLQGPENYGRYLVLASIWAGACLANLRTRHHTPHAVPETVQSGPASPGP